METGPHEQDEEGRCGGENAGGGSVDNGTSNTSRRIQVITPQDATPITNASQMTTRAR
jgi:hypothetical protein